MVRTSLGGVRHGLHSTSDPDLEEWLDTMMVEDQLPGVNDYGDLTFDDQGHYRTNTTIDINNADFYDTFQEVSEIYEDNYFIDRIEAKYNVNPHEVSSNDPDFEALRPNFAWAPVEVIKRTFDITTRWTRSIEHMPFLSKTGRSSKESCMITWVTRT